MIKDTSFIFKTLGSVKVLLIEVGFQKVKLSDILLRSDMRKSKFFKYFGGMYDLLEMIIYKELCECYEYIYHKTIGINRSEQKMKMVVHYRAIFIESNAVLLSYFSTEDKLSRRFATLKSKIAEIEQEFIEKYINKTEPTDSHPAALTVFEME